MGTTVATLHILRKAGQAPDDLIEAVTKAYTRLGWAPPKRGQTATRHLVLAKSGQYLTVHDDHCADLDDGTLREAAALLSKSLGIACLVTTLYDSDAYAFLMYWRGKQVDGAADPPFGTDDAIKTVRGKRQPTLWWQAFDFTHFTNLMNVGRRMDDQVARFVERSQAAAKVTSHAADDMLAAWCGLAGLPMGGVVATAADAETEGRVVARIALASRPVAAKPAEAEAPRSRVLAFQMSPDDCPYHGFFPAPYPCLPGARGEYMWGVTCRDGGIGRLAVRLALADNGGFQVGALSVEGYGFFNGQITTEKPLASASATGLVLDAPAFALRAPPPGSRSQAILLIKVVLTAPLAGEATLTPELLADDEILVLPPLRLRAARPDWVPLVTDRSQLNMARGLALLQLNTPALHTAVGIVPEPEDAARLSIRRLAEALVGQAAGCALHVFTMRHMTPGFSVPKASQVLPAADALGGKAWNKWFDRGGGYQTVTLGIAPLGAPWPLAGLSVQTELYDRHDPDVSSGRLFVSLWANAAEGALRSCGLDWDACVAAFSTWIDGAEPEQGWLADCAWNPMFSTYEDYFSTPYEALVVTSSGRALGSRLRFVGPQLWFGRDLAGRVSRDGLAGVAEVREVGTGLAVSLRETAQLADLEQILAPILPG